MTTRPPRSRQARGAQSFILCGKASGNAAVFDVAALPYFGARLDKAQLLLDRLRRARRKQSCAARRVNSCEAEPDIPSTEVLQRLRPLAAPNRPLRHHFMRNGGISERLAPAAQVGAPAA